MSITITEALAEIKTINKRLESKRGSILQYVARQDGVRDPLDKDGGSEEFIKRERQAIGDLETRVIALRRGIQHANDKTLISLSGTARTVSEWLTWRREIAPGEQRLLQALRGALTQARENARRQGVNIVAPGGTAEKPTDIIVNLNEKELSKQIEDIEEILGNLDGQLSLKNATVTIEE